MGSSGNLSHSVLNRHQSQVDHRPRHDSRQLLRLVNILALDRSSGQSDQDDSGSGMASGYQQGHRLHPRCQVYVVFGGDKGHKFLYIFWLL